MAANFSVFLSYRRDDTRHLSARIYEQLERQFGEGHVFFDVDTLPRYAGWDFEAVIFETVPQCRVFLAIIGRDWARLMHERLRDPKDFVQIELLIALNTPGVRVIPVLVDGAAMPTPADLPEALRGLLGKQNVVLPPDPHLRQAVNDLAKTLLATPAQREPDAPRPSQPVAALPNVRSASPHAEEDRAGPAPSVHGRNAAAPQGRLSGGAATKSPPKWLLPVGAAGLALVTFLAWSPWDRSAEDLAAATERVAPVEGVAEESAADPEAIRRAREETARLAEALYAESEQRAAFDAPAAADVSEAAASFDARISPSTTRAPVVSDPASLPDFSMFRECDGCPEMVVIPAGSFTMGSPASEAGRDSDEGPQVSVRVPRFAIARFETTWDEWAACVSAGVCQQREDSGYGLGQRPVINVDWETDTRAFLRFVNSGASGYRLPSEAEWEYAARAGTATAFSWGASIGPEQAQYSWSRSYNGGPTRTTAPRGTAPVGQFSANQFGLYDMHGNVWEWVEDCYRDNLSGQTSAAIRTVGCSIRAFRGGSWYYRPEDLRSATRAGDAPAYRSELIGFRLSRTL